MNQYFSAWILLTVLISAGGCDSSAESGAGASMEELAAGVDAQKAAQQKEQARLEAERKAEEERQAAAAAAAQQQPAPLEVVTAHSGKKGRSLQGGGYLSVVTGTRFWAENQINLDVLRHNMDIYKATNGDYPKTEEEFKKGILEAYEVKLPELPDGWEYAYDPRDPLTLYMRNTGTGDPSVAQ